MSSGEHVIHTCRSCSHIEPLVDGFHCASCRGAQLTERRAWLDVARKEAAGPAHDRAMAIRIAEIDAELKALRVAS